LKKETSFTVVSDASTGLNLSYIFLGLAEAMLDAGPLDAGLETRADLLRQERRDLLAERGKNADMRRHPVVGDQLLAVWCSVTSISLSGQIEEISPSLSQLGLRL
jgi:hypothetical protein